MLSNEKYFVQLNLQNCNNTVEYLIFKRTREMKIGSRSNRGVRKVEGKNVDSLIKEVQRLLVRVLVSFKKSRVLLYCCSFFFQK